jgi:D-alanyl-D-alanine-carboxypeptidase/D-alanyl-D-alanine-endopeptidase
MNLSLKTTCALVVTLAISGANPSPAAESFPTATPASQGLAVPVQAQSVPDIVGTWHGTAKTPAGEITLVLHVEHGTEATLSAKLENASQSPGNLALVSDIKVTSGHLVFRMARGNAAYEGDWDSAAQQWKGTFNPGRAVALNFAKGAPAPWQPPSDSEIGRLIAERNAPRAGQGIVVGVLGPDGQRIVAGGTGAGAKFDRNTLFEIGSISKVFTALILADMINRGEVSLDDPAAKYLPAGHKMPERNGRQTPCAISRRTARDCRGWPTTCDRSTIPMARSRTTTKSDCWPFSIAAS